MANLYENVLSIVGSPSPLLALPTQRELSKDEVFGGWTVPYPIFADWPTIFRIFGLWHNDNGICRNGKDVIAFSGAVRQFRTGIPVFVGDYLINRGKRLQVATVNNVYNSRNRFWEVWVEYGTPPRPRKVEELSFKHLVALYDALKEQKEASATLVSDFFTQVLPLCTAGGYPIVTAPAVASLEALLQAYNQKLDKKLEEVEKTQWRM